MTTPTLAAGHAGAAGTPRALARLAAAARHIAGGLVLAREGLAAYERLARLPDAELARRGLRREDLVHHAFRDFLAH